MLEHFRNQIFICPKCRQILPCNCGYEIMIKQNIIQLSDLPNMNIADDAEDNYIGYDHIGSNYSGFNGELVIEDYYKKACKVIKEELDDGILLDLGCGDGLFAVPLLMNNVKVIGGDISNNMMFILQKKLEKLNLDSSLLTLVRMNAYDIPIIDNSIDAVIANSMLHLNSNPEKIIKEIYRVLKSNGKFICFEDKPHSNCFGNEFDNSEYNERLEFHHRYFTYLKEMNIHPKRYSWKFNRDNICNKLFRYSYEVPLDIPKEIKKITFHEGFYKRMKSKGFSDQSGVPDDIHNIIFNKVDKEMIDKYGPNYTESVFTFYTKREFIKIYVKK